jgi:hypothetical protein
LAQRLSDLCLSKWNATGCNLIDFIKFSLIANVQFVNDTINVFLRLEPSYLLPEVIRLRFSIGPRLLSSTFHITSYHVQKHHGLTTVQSCFRLLPLSSVPSARAASYINQETTFRHDICTFSEAAQALDYVHRL